MCTHKNNDKNKTNFPLPPSSPVTVFLIAEKLLSLYFEIFGLSVSFY